MDKLTKLSQAIRYGATVLGVKEDQHFGVAFEGRYGCRAIGTAHLAAQIERQDGRDITREVAERFGVPLRVVARISSDHFLRKITHAQAADELEAMGY